jgi:hypothetical protein
VELRRFVQGVVVGIFCAPGEAHLQQAIDRLAWDSIVSYENIRAERLT